MKMKQNFQTSMANTKLKRIFKRGLGENDKNASVTLHQEHTVAG